MNVSSNCGCPLVCPIGNGFRMAAGHRQRPPPGRTQRCAPVRTVAKPTSNLGKWAPVEGIQRDDIYHGEKVMIA